MAHIIDLTESDGDLVVLGRAIVLPNSAIDPNPHPLNGSLRFNPEVGAAQLFHAGAWTTLGAGGGSAGDGTSNNHNHTIAQIVGLQNILNNKAPLVHPHTMAEITGLVAALANKAEVSHAHGLDQIVGARAELAAKADKVHSHSYVEKDLISASFPSSPPANYKLVYTAALVMRFPVNFAGSFLKVFTSPAATYAIRLLKNISTEVGQLIMYPNGTSVMSLPNGLELAPGDTLTFQCPARDSAINSISFSLVGTRDPQVTT